MGPGAFEKKWVVVSHPILLLCQVSVSPGGSYSEFRVTVGRWDEIRDPPKSAPRVGTQ